MQGILALTILLLCLPRSQAVIPTPTSPNSWVESMEIAFCISYIIKTNSSPILLPP